jgi:ABC-2 type transport system ATP-binding protein
MAQAILVRNVSKAYKSAGETVHALRGVSFSVEEGEIFGLLGPNGAGKTTLISILSGIITPDGGSASVLGYDCARDAKRIHERINVVSGFTGVVSSLTCEEALRYYCFIYNVKRPDETIDSVIRATGLEGSRHLQVEDFSSGMKQRHLIAKALLNDPRLIILDEPSVGLDVESATSIRAMVRRLRKEGRTILLTTHNMFEAEELCDRIAFINHGQIADVGTVPQLKEKIIKQRTIEINCSDSASVMKALSEIGGVEAVEHSTKLVHVSVDSYKRMKDIMRALSGLKSEIYNVSALEPTLEETYLRIIRGGGGGRA